MKLNVNFDKIVGKIKPMNQAGQPPFAGGSFCFNFSFMDYLPKANIRYSRLHDVQGPFGSNRYVDIPNLFRNFDADETDENNYDFTFTDLMIKEMVDRGLEPIFRLGVTIENQAHIKAYHIHPPKDPAKWARICEHVILHYNYGWANGFHYNIKYWEIWNEPDNNIPKLNQMWTGTPEQFFELYDVTAKHLKKCFGNDIKIGGYGVSGLYGIYYHPEKYGVDGPARAKDDCYDGFIHRVEFFLGFLEYITKNKSPIDFLSWHSYACIEETFKLDSYIYKKLTEYGYGDVEMLLDEWNNSYDVKSFGKSESSATTAGMMCAMQSSHTDMLCYYDTKLYSNPYCGFFRPVTGEPVCTYYSFVAFGELLALKSQAECYFEDMEGEMYALASTDGEKKAILLVNNSNDAHRLSLNADGDFKVYLVDETHFLTQIEVPLKDFVMDKRHVYLIKNY